MPIIQSLNFQFATPSGSSAGASSSASSARRRNLKAAQQQQAKQQKRDDTAGQSQKRAASTSNSGLGAKLLSLLPRSHEAHASPSLAKRADVMVPPSLMSSGQNEILASAFWQRDDGSFVNILGGNFTTTAGIRNLAFYDGSTNMATSFPAAPAQPRVRPFL